MTKPSTITKWLQQPASVSDEERQLAAAMVKTYPYFVPSRYMEAAMQHNEHHFDRKMMDKMHLYMANWVYFNDFLERALIPGYKPGKKYGDEMLVQDISFEEEEDVQDDTVNDYNDDFDAGDFEDIEDDDESLLQDLDDEPEIKPEAPAAPRPAMKERTRQAVPQTPVEQPVKKETPIPVDNHIEMVPDLPEPASVPPVTELLKEEETIIQPEVIPGPITTLPKPPKPEHPAQPQAKPQQQPFIKNRKEESLIQPIYTEDYFLHQGIQVPEQASTGSEKKEEKDKSLMVVMSFSEWLIHFKTKGEREKEELEDQKALKTMWQKEKLAAALEEENEEIPENVFEMAVNSITKEDDLASESLAEIMVKQGKYDKAIEMYRKLSLRNPQKNAYFARKIEVLNKEKLS